MSTFVPLDWQLKPLRDKSKILLLDGGSGSGKSRLAAEKVHAFCLKYPGVTCIVGRKDRASASKSVVPMLRYEVQRNTNWGAYLKGDQIFEYHNESMIYVVGLNDESQLEALKSVRGKHGDPEMAWFEEANALSLNDHDTVKTRLRGTVAPWHQLIYTTNPDSPEHWINKQLIEDGEAARYHSLPTDNPYNPDDYIDTLDGLSGIRYQKYRLGLWIRAEGIIYNDYDSSKHLVNGYDIKVDKTGRFIVGVDFGYTNPFSCSLWYVKDGSLYQIKQIYKTRRTVSEHCTTIREMVKGYPVEAWITDHDAEDRATLEKELDIKTTPAYKSVKDGLEAVMQRYKDDRLFHVRGGLVEEDMSLKDAKLPMCTYEEVPSYVWSNKKQDTPVKENDHGCFIAGTKIFTVLGEVPIENINIGDYVLTRRGYRKVSDFRKTQVNASVKRVVFSNGNSIIGTPDHPVCTKDNKYVIIDELRYGDTIRSLSKCATWLGTMVLSLGGIQTLKSGRTGCTIRLALGIKLKELITYIVKYGKTITEILKRDIQYITLTLTRLITQLTTLPVLQKANTLKFIPNILLTSGERGAGTILLRTQYPPQQNGMVRMKESNGIKNTLKRCGTTSNTKPMFANCAERNISQGRPIKSNLSFAQTTANHRTDVIVGLTTKSAFARIVEMFLLLINTLKTFIAPVHVLEVQDVKERHDVYNMTVENGGEYYANGILVSNCDEMRYVVCYVDGIGKRTTEINPRASIQNYAGRLEKEDNRPPWR